MAIYKTNPEGGRVPAKTLFKQFNPDGEYDLDIWHRTFIELSDITEYSAAIQLAGSWAEWQRIKRDWPGFNAFIQIWLEEVEVKIRSEAIRSLCASKDAGAKKFLAEGKYKEKLRGRPSNAEVAHERKVQARIAEDTDDEVNRVLEAIPKEQLN